MNKKYLRYILLLVSLFLFVFCISIKGIQNNENSFSSLCIDEEEYQTIKNNRKENNSIIVDLSFNGYKLFYDAKNNNYYYSLIKELKESYNPNVSWDSNDVQVSFKYNSIDSTTISNNKKIDVILYTDKEYYEANIACTTLPLINIQVNQDLIQRGYRKSIITVFDNNVNVEDRMLTIEGKVRVRGASTAEYEKKGFKINLESKTKEDNDIETPRCNLLALRQSDEYVLYAAYNDPVKIRNVFSCQLWYDSCAENNVLNLKNGVYYKYCELFINGEYWGLYALGFDVDEQQVQLIEDKRSPYYDYENIYKSVDWDWDATSIDEIISATFITKTSKNKNISDKILYEYCDTIINSNSIEEIYEMVDINNAIDCFLFYNLIQHRDGSWENDDLFIKNTYVVSKCVNDKIIILNTPWDLDRTWGLDFNELEYGYNNDQKYVYDYSKNYVLAFSPVYRLIQLDDKNIKLLIKDRYEYLRNNGWSNDNVLTMLEEYNNQIFDSGSYLRDKDRWPEGNYSNVCNDLSSFSNYVINRMSYFDKYIEEYTK